MNKLLTLLLLVNTLIHGQKTYPYINSYKIDSVEWKAEIDGIPITMHLELAAESEYHLWYGFIEGWYYYDRYEKKIPLKGYYAGPNGITLCSFEHDSIFQKQIDTVEFRGYWDEHEFFDKVTEYKERFKLFSGYGRKDGIWETKEKSLDFEMISPLFDLGNEYEWLVMSETDSFNLRSLQSGIYNFEYVSHLPDSNRYLLKFEHNSNPNVMGRCGGGIDKGYLSLDLSQNEKPKFKYAYIESCYQFQYSESFIENKELEQIEFMVVMDYGNLYKEVTIDKKNAKVIETEMMEKKEKEED